jgi:hypothetical protein
MRGTQPMCGQLWTQENRQMTVTNIVKDSLDNSRELVALSGVYDAFLWRHDIEVNGPAPIGHAPSRASARYQAQPATPQGLDQENVLSLLLLLLASVQEGFISRSRRTSNMFWTVVQLWHIQSSLG